MKCNIFSFSPVNFHDWDLYNKLEPIINYTAKGKILNEYDDVAQSSTWSEK